MDIPSSYFDLIKNNDCQKCSDCVDIATITKLPTRFGDFFALAFHQSTDSKEHMAIVKGDVVGKKDVLVRLHSECLTGDAIGSLRCDCRDQLEGGLTKIENEGQGVLLYLRQEGRGIGLTNKLRAYSLQDKGMNTVEANLALGFPNDAREYYLASCILKILRIHSIQLLTNNPDKIKQLEKHGIKVSKRVKHYFTPNMHNQLYLQAKKELCNHSLGAI